MKKMMKLLTVVAAAAMGLTSCQNGFEENDVNGVVKGSVVVSFVSEEARTSVDTSGDTPLFSWNENEDFVVLEETDALAEATSVAYTKVDGKANIDAEFAANAGKGAYKYVAVYPKAGFVSADNINEAVLALPSEQSAVAGSYDPNADLMVSMPVTTTEQPTEAQPMRFTRLAAVAKMTVKGLPEGEVIEKVEFTANGKNLAGTITANLENPHEFSVKEGVSTVSVTTNSARDVYFTVLPTTLEADDAYSVVVLTDKHLYVKEGTIPAEQSLVFEAGMVSRFPVNMGSVAPSGKWVLVRDASTLEAGDVVTIATKNNNFVLGCNSTTTFLYASYTTDIVKVGDYLYHPVVTDKSKYSYMVQPLILSKQDASKAAFDFYNGVDYEGDTKNGYLTNADTNNYLKLSAYPSKNSAFEISVTDGVATIEAKESEFDNVLLKFYHYNPNNTTNQAYRRFGCIDAASIDAAKHDDVCIYKWVGKKETVPTADAVISVPKQVVVGVEGVAEPTAFEDVKFTYIGSWNIEVSSSDEWLKLNYADGVLKYTATANPGGVRTAKVTITATHEGDEAQPLEFEVLQKGVPTKVTVEQFIELAQTVNANVEYEVTGILSTKPSSAGGTTKIKDAAGKEASFSYVYMTGNSTPLSENTDIEKGDVVTIIAAVASKGYGGSSSAHAICKGYYNFSATAEKDLVGYEGGNVKLNLTKSGNLDPIADITCSVNETFAEVAYTANAEEATVTLAANDGAPRQVVATFSDGLASTSVTIVQSADTAKGNTWELVTDASTLSAYDQVIVAAATYDVAMGKTIDSNDRRPSVDVTKLGNYYLLPTESTLTLVLGKGSVDGTFAFYDAVNEGYLVSSSTSSSTYKLKNQTYIDANTSYAISIAADGIATIGNKEGAYSSCKFGYRAGSNKYFFSGTSTSQEKVCLYRLVGVKGTIPVAPAAVTVPSKSVVVPEQATTEATAIDTVEFNYVGDWNISAVAVDSWISFEFDKAQNKLTYTALKNESSARETTVTITASMEGQPSKTWTFKVLQKGKPMVITCDALNDKEKNVDVSYQLTGRIVSIPSSASGNFVLDDGSGRQANICYLYTEDDSKAMYNNTDVGLAVGDVVTVTTIVYTNGKGGNTNYHSTYKGHYRLTATASTELVSHEGGTATIALATEGNLQPADAVINGTLVKGNDFVTFDYTTGASTATATFAANDGASRDAEFKFTFGLATVSVVVGQYNHPDVKVGWFLVTNLSELAVGDKVIIAAKSPDGSQNYAIKKYTTTNSTSPGVAITLQGNSIKDVSEVEKFTLGSGDATYANTWSFKCDSYSKYLYQTGSAVKFTSTLDNTSSWAITIAEDGKATLVSQTTNSANTMMFNYTAYNQVFSMYSDGTTGKGAIYIYKYYNSLAQ